VALDKPRFRRDLLAVPLEADGQSYVEVRDPSTRKRFCLYDFEYRVALAFDGLELGKVIPWVKLSAGLELSIDQLQEFAARLRDLGLLEGETSLMPRISLAEAANPSVPEEVVLDDAVTLVAILESEEHVQANQWSEDAQAAPSEDATAAEPPAAEFANADAPEAEAEVAVLARPAAAEEKPVAEGASAGDASADQRDPPAPVIVREVHKAGADSTAFPVLPSPSAAVPEPAPSASPPPWATPRPLVAPSGSRPAAMADASLARRRPRLSFAVFAALGVLAAGAVLAAALPFLPTGHETSRANVRTVVAVPGSILRYFDGVGAVEVMPTMTLEFPAAGKVTHIVAAGGTVALDDVVAAVEVARRLQTQLVHQRERLAFYQQMAEAMHQIGNAKEEDRQVASVQVRNAGIAKTLRALADVAVLANRAGQIEEVLAHEGESVRAHSPAVRVRPLGVRAEFDFSREQTAKARRLGFCQIEVEGYVFDCAYAQEENEAARFRVELSSVPTSLIGKPARLARARFNGATVVPTSAILRTKNRDEVLVFSPHARVEVRSVLLADEEGGEVVVLQGLDAGDKVVVEPTSGLKAGAVVGLAP
jgi:hypothetical protein